jgi:tRNA nucleotidyltransferase (CCA-adding enzyme)
MDLVLCHTTADFDTLGAAVGLARLQPGRRIVLTGGCHPTVQRFLALHRDEYPLIERRAVNPDHIRCLTLVDAQQSDRFGPAAEWIALAQRRGIPVVVVDHHPASSDSPGGSGSTVEAVGAATTLVVEALQRENIAPSIAEATVMALGIHVDTGSLLYESATARDAAALAWLMEQGASLAVVADFVEPGLSPALQDLLSTALDQLTVEAIEGHGLAWVLLEVDRFIPGLSGLAERLMALTEAEALLLGACYPAKDAVAKDSLARESPEAAQDVPQKLTLIGRGRGGRGGSIDWGQLFAPLGGGGHATAAAASLTTAEPQAVMERLLTAARSQIPPRPVARDLMSSPVRTIRPDTTVEAAQRILLRYGHSGLSVVDEGDRLVGVLSRRDLDLATHHGLGHAPVKGYMATNLKTIAPDTPLTAIEHLMVTYDIGRLPVLRQGQLVGIVTRTDLLRHLHQGAERGPEPPLSPPPEMLLKQGLETCLSPRLREVLHRITAAAEARGWHLYLVGGAVRDLLISCNGAVPAGDRPTDLLPDLDLVVDGGLQAAQVGAGVELAEAIRAQFPEVDVQVHGQFQTASLVWRKDLTHPLAGLMIDIATARTEFYPYPAANPEVEASSIQQDLYRRDFTINALALRLTEPGAGQLLDYFGGVLDLGQGTIRVLHANSFIEDPTRIYRAVRFAVRLGFSLDPQTEGYIRHAIASGVYAQMQRQMARAPALQTRLKTELRYILAAPYWQRALALLDQLQALRCLHDDLAMTPALWSQLRRLSRWARRYPWPELEPAWLLRLEGLLAAVPPEGRSPLATALQLPDRTIARLAQLDALERAWLALVATQPSPSQLYAALSRADRGTLLLISARHPRSLGPAIWRHLRQWLTADPLIDGHGLRALGYRPGPQFKPMLAALFAAQLDGAIGTEAEAKAFLAERYPLPQPRP